MAVTQVAVQLSVAGVGLRMGFSGCCADGSDGRRGRKKVSGKVSGLRDWKDVYGDREGCRMAGLGREVEISDQMR